jgi:hypothetical protein
MYGRAYRNQTQDGYTPELFIGGIDYYDTFFDDTLSANSFFGVGDVTTIKDGSSTADCFLIFCVNLQKVKPGNDRNDEAVHVDVQKLCIAEPYGFRATGWVTGIDSVFKEYSGWKKSDGIKFRDEHPYHCFRLNFKLLYNINDC